MPDPVKPVGKLRPLQPLSQQQEANNEEIKPVGNLKFIGNEEVVRKGFDPLKNTPEEEKIIAVAEDLKKDGFSEGLNDDEKKYLTKLAQTPGVTADDYFNAKDIVMGEHEKQNGYQTWYKDLKTGMPVPLAPGEKAPKGTSVESVWGSQQSAEDDSIFTTIGKNLGNTLPQFIDAMGDVGATAYTLATGEEPEWYKAQQVRLQALQGKTSSASQEEIFNTENVESFSDLLDPNRFNFTAQNVAGGLSQAASSILQFMGANVLTGGVSLASKGAKGLQLANAIKGGKKAKQLVAGMSINMGETLEMAEQAGLEGREKFAFGSLVSIPVAFVEMNMGLTGKLLGSTAAQAEKNIITKAALSKLVKDANGNITKQSLKQAYKETMIRSASFGKRWAKEVVKQGIPEASEEMAQGFIQDGSAQIYDKLFGEGKEVGEGKFGKDALSPEAFANRINEGIIGFMAGAKAGGVKVEKQSQSAYEAVEKGEVSALKAQIKAEAKSGNITQEDADLAEQKINSYQKYYEQTEGLDLKKKDRKRVFDLTFTNENLQTQIDVLSKNKESQKEGTIPNRNLAARKKLLADNVKEIDSILAKPIAEQQNTMAEKTKEDITPKEEAAIPKEEKTTTKPSLIKGFKGKKTTDPAITLLEQIKNAENEKDIDAFIAEADEKGIVNKDHIDAAGFRREKLREKTPEKIPQTMERKDLTPTTPIYDTKEEEDTFVKESETALLKDNIDKELAISLGEGKTSIGKIKNEDGIAVLETRSGTQYELGGYEGVQGQTLGGLGLSLIPETTKDKVVASENKEDFTIRNKKYKNLFSKKDSAINRDENGDILSVTLTDEKGKNKTFRGDVADEVALNILLGEVSKQEVKEKEIDKIIEEVKNEPKQRKPKKPKKTGTLTDKEARELAATTKAKSPKSTTKQEKVKKEVTPKETEEKLKSKKILTRATLKTISRANRWRANNARGPATEPKLIEADAKYAKEYKEFAELLKKDEAKAIEVMKKRNTQNVLASTTINPENEGYKSDFEKIYEIVKGEKYSEEKEVEETIAKAEEKQKADQAKVDAIKAPKQEDYKTKIEYVRAKKKYHQERSKVKKDIGGAKQGILDISDDDIMAGFWAIVEAVLSGTTTIEKGLKNLRKGFTQRNTPLKERMDLEEEFFNQIQEEPDSKEAQEKIALITERLKLKDYAKMQIGDGDAKIKAFTSKVRSFYSGTRGFKNDTEIEEMLVSIAKDKSLEMSKDFEAGIDKLFEQAEEENNEKKRALALRLRELSEPQLTQLFVIFESTTNQGYIETRANYKGKTDLFSNDLEVTNSSLEESLINQVEAHMASITEAEFQKAYRANNLKKRSFDNDVKFLIEVTGIPLEQWMVYKENFKDFKPHTLATFISRGHGNLDVSTKAKFLDNITRTKGKGKGSALNTIARFSPLSEKIKYINSRFKNVEWNQKSAAELEMHLNRRLNELKEFGEEKEYQNNEWVQNHKGENAPLVVMTNGASNTKNNKKAAAADNMSEEDVKIMLYKSFVDSKRIGVPEGSYLQNTGQFGDKGRMVFVQAKKYSLEEAKSKYKKLLKAEGIDVNKAIKILEDNIQDFASIAKTNKNAEEFIYNYALNYHNISHFINGKQEQYAKGGKSPHIDMIKRGGSVASPGIVLNKYTEGGVGESHKIAIVNIPEYSHDGEGLSLIDGQEFITQEWSDKVKKSSGGMFHTIIKAITSNTTNEGNRLLVKTGAVTIDALAEQYPNSEYAKIAAFMKENGIDRLVTKDGAKYDGNVKKYDLFDENGKVSEKRAEFTEENLGDIKTEEYLVQQDLVNDGKPGEGSVPIQRKKNMMHSKEASEITELYNDIAKKTIDKVSNQLLSLKPNEWRAYLMQELGINQSVIDDAISNTVDSMSEEEAIDTQDTDAIKNLIIRGVSFHHPQLSKWMNSFVANIVTEQALGRKANKSLLVEAGYLPSEDFELKEHRVEGDKVFLPEIAVSEATGLRGPKEFDTHEKAIKEIKRNKGKYQDMYDSKGNIKEHEIVDGVIPGEYAMVTRIPADAMHSTSLSRVKYLLPKSMGNVIITSNQSQRISGSDFDGDQRHVESLFKNKEGIANLEDGSLKSTANRAFQLDTEWFYDPKNASDLLSAINDKAFNSQLAHLPEEKEMAVDSPSTYVDARKKNTVGLAVVGAMANYQAVYDYLRVHKSRLKESFSFPKISLSKRKITGKSKMDDFKDDSNIKNVIGNLLNLALDNVKNPRIEKLGLNEVTSGMFNAALMLGADQESVIAFFNHPMVREYTKRQREATSVNSKTRPDEVIPYLAAEYMDIDAQKVDDVKIEAYKRLKGVSADVNSKTFKNPGSLEVLQMIRKLNKIAKDFNTIHTVIRATENAPKSWADYQHSANAFKAISENEMEFIDTKEFKESAFIESAKYSLNLAADLVTRTAPEVTELGIEMFDKVNLVAAKEQRQMNKKELNAFSSAINNMLLFNSRKRESNYDAWSKKLLNKFNQLKESGTYPEITNLLEVVSDKAVEDVYNGQTMKVERKMTDTEKLQLLENYKRDEIPEKTLKAFQKKVNQLRKSENQEDLDLYKDLIDYAVFKYNYVSSKANGSYAVLFPIEVQEEIGKATEAEYKLWDEGGYTEIQQSKIFNSIAENNPLLNPTLSKEARIATISDKIYEPFAEKVYEITIPEAKQSIYDSLKDGSKTELKLSMTNKANPAMQDAVRRAQKGDVLTIATKGKSFKLTVANKTLNEDKSAATFTFEKIDEAQQQKIAQEPTNKTAVEKVVDVLSKAIPGATVVYDDRIKGAGQLDADGKTVRINPLKAGTDTPIHEFGHIIIDAMGGVKNAFIARGIKQLKGTTLWNETKKKYPELNDEMLAKEVLSEAIGREGAKIFKTKQQQSKFMSWLSGLLYTIKAKLGIERNVAKKLANDLLSKKDLQFEPTATGQVQKQKESTDDSIEKEREESRIKKELEALEQSKIANWEDYMGDDYFDFKRSLQESEENLQAAKTKEDKSKFKQEIKQLNEYRDQQIKNYERYLESFEAVKEFYSKRKLENKNAFQLNNLYYEMKALDTKATTHAINDILEKIARKALDTQMDELRKNPQFDEDKVSQADLKRSDPMMKALSDFTEAYPEMQYLAKEYFSTYENMIEERETIKKEIFDKSRAVIKEDNKKRGIIEMVKDFFNPFSSNAKYWEFMDVKGKMIHRNDKEFKNLTQAQKDLVNLLNETKLKYKQWAERGNSSFDIKDFVKNTRSFSEIYSSGQDGVIGSYLRYISIDPSYLNGVMLKYNNTLHSYGNIKKLIASDKSLSKPKKIYLVAKYKMKAKKQAAAKKHEDGTPYKLQVQSEFKQEDNGRLSNKYSRSWAEGKEFSRDYVNSMMDYVDEMNFVKHMEKVLPLVDAIEHLASETDEKGNPLRPNFKRYITNIVKNKNILRSDEEVLDPEWNVAIKFLRKLTHLRVMAFNIPAGAFNIIIGKYNQFRGDHAKHMGRGEARYWKNYKKTQAILRKYQAVSIEVETNPASHIGKFFDMAMFGFTKAGENWIQGGGVIGQLTNEEWAMFNNDGTLKEEGSIAETKDGKKFTITEKMLNDLSKNMGKYKKVVRDLQGKYAEEDKRGFGHFEIGRAMGQFKIWLPDTIKDRFGSKYINMNGEVKQGTFNYLAREGVRDMVKQLKEHGVFGTLKQIKDSGVLTNSMKREHVLIRRNIRSAILMGSLLAVYGAAKGDDDDEYKGATDYLMKTIKDMSFAFNLDQMIFTIKQPIPAAGTLTDFLEALDALLALDVYKTSGKHGEAGDLKATHLFENLLPYKNVAKIPKYLGVEE